MNNAQVSFYLQLTWLWILLMYYFLYADARKEAAFSRSLLSLWCDKLIYSLLSTATGLLLAAFKVCDPIIMNAISSTASKPANSSVACTGV